VAVLHRAHTSGLCSALEQLLHSAGLLLSLSAAASSVLGRCVRPSLASGLGHPSTSSEASSRVGQRICRRGTGSLPHLPVHRTHMAVCVLPLPIPYLFCSPLPLVPFLFSASPRFFIAMMRVSRDQVPCSWSHPPSKKTYRASTYSDVLCGRAYTIR
jgi:hypothetical protein